MIINITTNTSPRKIAIVVGILFLIALFFNIAATAISDPILTIPDYLTKAYSEKTLVIVANLLNLISAIAMIFIPITLFPVAKKHNEHLALGYVVFRFLEGVLFIYIAIKTLTLISLSKAYIAGTQSTDNLQILGDSIQSEINWALIVYVTIFSLGAMIFYSLLYTSKLVPRFLSTWGLLAVALLFTGVISGIFGIGVFSHTPFLKGMTYFAPPIALNELTLAIWLIVKGFSPLSFKNST